MRMVHLERIEGLEAELVANLEKRQGGYATDTGKWIVRTSKGEIKKYTPDSDLLDAASVLRMPAEWGATV